MTLKYTVTPEEHASLDEGIKGLYADKDGVLTLDVEGSTSKTALEKERSLRSEFEKKYKAYEALGKSAEEISKLLQEPQKGVGDYKDKDKNQGTQGNLATEELQKMRDEIAAQRAEMAALLDEQRAAKRELVIASHFDGYSAEQKADFAALLKAKKGDELPEAIKGIKERYPLVPEQKRVGGRTNPSVRSEGSTKEFIDSMLKSVKENSAKTAEIKGF